MSEFRDILDEFIQESRELLEQAEGALIELERRPQEGALLDAIFRAFHTIKGTASFVGLERTTQLTHRAEDLLNRMRKGELPVTPAVLDVLFSVIDRTRRLIESVQSREAEEESIDDVLLMIEVILDVEVGPGRPISHHTEAVEGAQTESDASSPIQPSQEGHAASRSGRAGAEPRMGLSEQTIRVDVERLDHLMHLVGELVLSRNQLLELARVLRAELQGNDSAERVWDMLAQLDWITNEIQRAVTRTRMVPVGRVFARFERMVRDLARELEKSIRFEAFGADTEVDKSVAEVLVDPLVHLIRNAVDHGIESPSERLQRGKPAEGKVQLRAYQEGNTIVLEVSDDGRGIDPNFVRRRAVEKGLLSREAAEGLSDLEALQLIFLPGFSTRTEASNLSGRGVGMDVVRTNLARIGGSVSVQTEPGQGTTFTLRLPLTLAIIPGLTVGVYEECFIIPLSTVLEIVRLSDYRVEVSEGRRVIVLRDQILPLYWLHELLQVPAGAPPAGEYVVVLAVGEQRFGLVVHTLVGQEEVVVKSIGSVFGQLPGIAGGTIRGNGQVGIILDIPELYRYAQTLAWAA